MENSHQPYGTSTSSTSTRPIVTLFPSLILHPSSFPYNGRGNPKKHRPRRIHPTMARAKLALENGMVFPGSSFGAEGESLGEVVFNTSMTGYQEIMTDPSYHGQIVTMTYPEIGNYGINAEDVESDRPRLAGFVVRQLSRRASNYRLTQQVEELPGEAQHRRHRRHRHPHARADDPRKGRHEGRPLDDRSRRRQPRRKGEEESGARRPRHRQRRDAAPHPQVGRSRRDADWQFVPSRLQKGETPFRVDGARLRHEMEHRPMPRRGRLRSDRRAGFGDRGRNPRQQAGRRVHLERPRRP